MTVINMLSFGNEGVAVADEQASNILRKYNVVQKLNLIDGKYIYGGSGPSDFIKSLYELTKSNFEKRKEEYPNMSLNGVFRLLNEISCDQIDELKNNCLEFNLGINLNDLLTGLLSRTNKPLDEQAKNAGRSILQQLEHEISFGILLGGIENDKFCIYEVNSNGLGRKISTPYASVGSGSDESNKVLSSYVAKLPRDKRESIDIEEGLIKIIEATNSSARMNVGVGGSFSIFYISKKRVVVPEENKCVLSSEIVEGYSNRLLGKDFSYEAVKDLILNDGEFEKIEEKMKNEAKDWKKLDRILRGYKE